MQIKPNFKNLYLISGFRAYDLTSVIEELEDIRRTFTSFKEGSRVDLGLKKIKELFEKSGRDWVAQVHY